MCHASAADSAILTEIQIAVVTTFALIPLLLLQSMGGTEPTSQGSSQDAKFNWSLQPRRVRLVAASAFCGTLLLAAGPVAADFQGTVYRTGGAGVNVRDCPHVSCASTGVLSEGRVVDVSCQAKGDNVHGNVAWDFAQLSIYSGGYVSDYYLRTPYPDSHPFAPHQPSC